MAHISLLLDSNLSLYISGNVGYGRPCHLLINEIVIGFYRSDLSLKKKKNALIYQFYCMPRGQTGVGTRISLLGPILFFFKLNLSSFATTCPVQVHSHPVFHYSNPSEKPRCHARTAFRSRMQKKVTH